MMTELSIPASNKPVSHEVFATVREVFHISQKALYSDRAYHANEVICSFGDRGVFTEPSKYTVQAGPNRHILLSPAYLEYANHSCDPNIFFDTTTMQVICIKDIRPGDEITFFYPSTEWDMAEPFACHCNAYDCLYQIQGAAHLSDQALAKYRLTDFIKQELAKRSAKFEQSKQK